jgi:hypothetical protein
VAPARQPPVQHVENQRDGDQHRRRECVSLITGADKFHRLEDRRDAAKAIGYGEEIGQMKAADHRKMSGGRSQSHNRIS